MESDNKKVGHNYGHEHDHENKNDHGKDVNPATGNHRGYERTNPKDHSGTITNQGHGKPGQHNNKRDKNNPNKTRGDGTGNK